MSAYQGIVDEYNDMVRGAVEDSRAAMDEGISDGLATQLERIKEKADEYSEKFSALAEGGIGEIAGLQGLKSTYKAVQDARAKWKKFRGDSDTDARYLGGRNPADAQAEARGLSDETIGRVRATLAGERQPLGAQTGITTTARGERTARAELRRIEGEAEPDAEPDIQAQIDAQPPAQEINIAGDDAPAPVNNVTDDQIDSMVAQARDDVNEGVGIENAPSGYSVGGIQYGKTGAGADAKSAPVSSAEKNPTTRLTADEPDVAVSQPLASTEPIAVSKIGVKKAAEEFSARADQSAQAVASIQPDDLKSVVRAKYQALSGEDKQTIAAKVRGGEIDGNDLQAVGDEIDKLRSGGVSRPPPALAAEDVAQPEPSFPEGFAADIEQAGRSAEASVRATADPVRFRTRPQESEGQQITDADRGVFDPEELVGNVGGEVRAAAGGLRQAASSGIRRLLGLGGEGEVGGLEMLGAAATPVGEAIAVGAGIVSVVDGLVHLFHPPKHSPAPLSKLGDLTPQVNQQITSKFASAIPTIDTPHEVGGFASF